MKLAFDSYYYENKAKTVCIQFDNWIDSVPLKIYSEIINSVEEYEAGAFYKRELPCILSLLKNISIENLNTIVVDSFVVLDDFGKIGLGGYLYEYLNKSVPVIGVAKTNFAQNRFSKREIYRGQSKKPLYITALGVDLDLASEYIKSMVGEYRIPTLFKQLDAMTKDKNG